MTSYAVLWSERKEGVDVGRLELDTCGLRFEGARVVGGAPRTHRLYYEDIEAMRVGREPSERLAGRPSLVVDRYTGSPVRIGSIEGIGALHELVERLGHRKVTALAV